MVSSYAAIAGSVSWTGFTESRLSPNSSTPAGTGTGQVSSGGVLCPNCQTRMADISDGTSNILLVSEQSDWISLNNGTRSDFRAGMPAYFATGSWGSVFNSGACCSGPPSGWPSSDSQSFNTTTIKYTVNNKNNSGAGWPAGAVAAGVNPETTTGAGYYIGDCTTGVCFWTGANTPLNSAHPGGVNALFGDGTVRFLSNNTDIIVLSQLATRDDGQVISNAP
jgi:prepilin-type processing-associated H-X9-DG protein